MSLAGEPVRIIVHEPSDWKNLFGRIVSDSGGKKLLVKLSDALTGKEFISNLIELRPISEEENFKLVSQYYAVAIIGSLLDEASGEFEYIIAGTVTLD